MKKPIVGEIVIYTGDKDMFRLKKGDKAKARVREVHEVSKDVFMCSLEIIFPDSEGTYTVVGPVHHRSHVINDERYWDWIGE